MIRRPIPIITARIAASVLALALAGCGAQQGNPMLYSVRQPVVERSTYALDLPASGGTLSPAERERLAGWFDRLALGSGDRVAVDSAVSSDSMRADIAALVARRGAGLESASPAVTASLPPGQVRVLVTRNRASVPGCPNWTDKSDADFGNSTSPGFGCAVNGNLAAMIANPEHLLEGAEGTGSTMAMTASKAIASYREQKPTGEAGLSETSSRETGE